MKFSVLMSVYKSDEADWFTAAINSVTIAQTVKPSELVIVVDGPVPVRVKNVIDSISDKALGVESLKVVNLPQNVGLAAALNIGLKHCSHEFVARMDSDDISHHDRFLHQVRFLNDNPDIDVLGGQVFEFDGDIECITGYRVVPLSHDDILSYSRFKNPIRHPSVIYRKRAVLDMDGYGANYPEDYLLWVSLLQRGYTFANLPQQVVYFRAGDEFYKRRGFVFLKGEIRAFIAMYKMSYISLPRLLFNISSYALLRSLPFRLKRLAYRSFR